MISSKEDWEDSKEKELHESDPFAESYEYDMGRENYLLSLLNNTIYNAAKKKEYEDKISMGITSMGEYESLKSQFLRDKIDSITMKGAGSMREIKHKLGKLK